MPPQTVTYYEVETTGGRSLLFPNAYVLSHVSGNTYLRKSVQDVKHGERVIFLNEHIERTLEEVEPFLAQSPRYGQSEDALFLRNSQGQKIPVLRAELIRGLNGLAPGFSYPSAADLEARIMKEGVDFSPEDYRAMRYFLQSRLEEYAVKEPGVPARKEHAITDWLTGETVAPASWNTFYALSLITGNRAFDDIFAPVQKGPSFQDHLKVYNAVRSGIMSWLAKGRLRISEYEAQEVGSATYLEPQAGQKLAAEGGIHLTLEMRIVMSEFFQEISPHFSNVRVLLVTPKTDSLEEGEPATREAKRRRLHKGIYAQPTTPEGAETSSLNELGIENNIFIYLFETITTRFLSASHNEQLDLSKFYIELPGCPVVARDDFISFICRLIEGKTISGWGQEIIPSLQETGLGRLLHGYADEFYSAIISGAADSALQLPKGTAYKLYEALTNIRRALPKIFYEVASLEHQVMSTERILGPPLIRVSRQERRALEAAFQDAKRKLRTRYSFDPTASKSLLARLLARLLNSTSQTETFNLETVMGSEKTLRRFEPESASFLTKQEVESILARYGMQALMQFIHPNNFIFDNQHVARPSA